MSLRMSCSTDQLFLLLKLIITNLFCSNHFVKQQQEKKKKKKQQQQQQPTVYILISVE